MNKRFLLFLLLSCLMSLLPFHSTAKKPEKSKDKPCMVIGQVKDYLTHVLIDGAKVTLLLFSTLIAVNGRKSLKINKVTLCIWVFGWRKLSLHHVRTQEAPQIRCL